MIELIGARCPHKDCGQESLSAKDKYYEDGYLVEYTTYCKSCGRSVGSWSYGSKDTYEEED